jgi:hypothetical protein
MKAQTWFYEGLTFVSPEFKQQGKPFIINRAIKDAWLNALPKKKILSLSEKIKLLLNPEIKRTQSLFKSENQESKSESLEETLDILDSQEKENEEEDLNGISEEWIK